MLARLKSKIRIGDQCKRCNHSKKEHTAICKHNIVNGRAEWIQRNLCGHWKKGKDPYDSNHDNWCDCRGYV